MENYKLGEDEVPLYQGNVSLCNVKGTTELILTNLNVVFITKRRKLFSQDEVSVISHSVSDIKIYQEMPQIRPKGSDVEIFFKTEEVKFSFYSKSELKLFMNEALKLFTGKSGTERKAEKVKSTIALVDDTLGVDSVGAVGKFVKNGVVGSLTGMIGKIGKNLLKKK